MVRFAEIGHTQERPHMWHTSEDARYACGEQVKETLLETPSCLIRKETLLETPGKWTRSPSALGAPPRRVWVSVGL